MRAREWTPWLVALSLLLALSTPSRRDHADDTTRSSSRGKVIVGVNTTTPIFGLVGTDGHPEGYDPDVARLGQDLGVTSSSSPSPERTGCPFC